MLPKWIWRGTFSLPYAMFVLAAMDYTLWGFVAAGAVLILTFTAVATGHGNYQDLGEWKNENHYKSEQTEFLINWLMGRINNYWYDALGLSVTGLIITLPAGIVLCSPLIALSGALKGPAYMVGALVSKRWPTRAGEWLTGACLWGSLAAILMKGV